MSDITVTMPLEAYDDLARKEKKLKALKKLAKDILVEHTDDDWSKPSDLKEALTFDESQLLLQRILGNNSESNS